MPSGLTPSELSTRKTMSAASLSTAADKRAQEEAQDAAGGQLLLFLPLAFYSGLCAILHPSNKTKTITRVTCVYSLGFFFLNNH